MADFTPVTVKARCVDVEQYDMARKATLRLDCGAEFVVNVAQGTAVYEAVACQGREVYLTLTPTTPEWAEILAPLAGAAL